MTPFLAFRPVGGIPMGNGKAIGKGKANDKGTKARKEAPQPGGDGGAGWPHFGRFSDRYYPSCQLDDLQGEGAAAEALARGEADPAPGNGNGKLKRSFYEEELARLQVELVKMQYWIRTGSAAWASA